MKNQPLTANECIRLWYPIPEGTEILDAWHLSEDGKNVVRAHRIAQASETSVAELLETTQN